MRVTTNTLTGPVQIALEAPGITIHSQSTWTKSSGQVNLYVRGGANPTTLSGPLEAAIRNGDIGLRYIP